MTRAHRADITADDQATDVALDAILSGEDLSPDADPALRGLAASLSALTATAEPHDHEVPERIQHAYRNAFVTSNLPEQFDRKRARRRPMLKSLVSARAAAVAVVAGGISLGGLTAAYAGALPDAAQNLAHHTIGAPAPKPHQPAGKPVGPDASGHSAYGLCTAWQHAHDSGKAAGAPAFRNLVAAAGGADQVDGYCASVLATKDGARGKDHMHSSPSPKPTPEPKGKAPKSPPGKTHTPAHGNPEHSTGKPTDLPTHENNSHGKGQSDSAHSGHENGHKPLGVPAGNPHLGGHLGAHLGGAPKQHN